MFTWIIYLVISNILRVKSLPFFHVPYLCSGFYNAFKSIWYNIIKYVGKIYTEFCYYISNIIYLAIE